MSRYILANKSDRTTTAPGRKSWPRNIVIVLSAVSAVLAAISVVPPIGAQVKIEIDTTMSGPFSLTDHNGRATTERDFRGRYMLVFFGYTSCPDVCPTHLRTMGRTVELLGDEAGRVQPVFISIDPQRDTENLKEYVRHFHPNMLGLTGTPEQVAAAAQAYGAYYVKVLNANSDASQPYLIDHTTYIYLLGPDGRFRAAFDHSIGVDNLAAEILQHLEQN